MRAKHRKLIAAGGVGLFSMLFMQNWIKAIALTGLILSIVYLLDAFASWKIWQIRKRVKL